MFVYSFVFDVIICVVYNSNLIVTSIAHENFVQSKHTRSTLFLKLKCISIKLIFLIELIFIPWPYNFRLHFHFIILRMLGLLYSLGRFADLL